MLFPLLAFSIWRGLAHHQDSHDEYLAGYLIIPTGDRVERSFNAGFSMYVATWSLLRHYPGHRFQTGLPGTWMFAQYDDAPPKDMYSDVEGGLGWWTDTRFPSETPKFIMGGVGPNFSEIANGPAHGAGSWDDPKGLYGVAQLSPWLLFPIDGLDLKKGSAGELFGYGYLNLPLLDPKPTTDGKPVPTGGNCWTLFVNSKNFKGPVAFFTPHFWSHAGSSDTKLVGKLLDSRPVDPNTAIQMETQYIPCRIEKDKLGESYARIAPTSFPANDGERSALVHESTSYNKSALWDSVDAWFKGGSPSKGLIDPTGAHVRSFTGNGYSTWEMRTPGENGKESKVPMDWSEFSKPLAIDSKTYGYSWDSSKVTWSKGKGALVTLPEYFHLEKERSGKKARWVPIAASLVPAEAGLQKLAFDRPQEEAQESYTTPEAKGSSWKTPGPAAGPFKAKLADGSVVTYYWYRFADQPALLNADLTTEEREKLQAKVEKIHRAWPRNHDYLASPAIGTLASVDPAQIVKPPKGLEFGYVPIATKQEIDTH